MKYFIKTFGCQMNVSDSERVAGFLEAQKFKPAKDIKKADLVIFNTCGVRQTAEDRVYGQIHNIRKQGSGIKNHGKKKIIILTGCLAGRKDVWRKLNKKVDLFFPINDFSKFKNYLIENLLKIINCPLAGEAGKLKIAQRKNLPTQESIAYLSVMPKYTETHQAFVPIMTGCNNFCSYCVVPYARGKEISRPAKDIIKEITSLAKNGCKEITLLGQNVNSYKYVNSKSKLVNRRINNPNYQLLITNYKKITFSAILNYLASNYPEITFKFLTSHPKDFSEELMDVIAKNKNISREIHLPLQSGSDKILKAMNRPYTQKYYLDLIKKIKKKIPEASFTTDVIVGFPGETKKDFSETVKVFKKIKYGEAYINKYSPRPGTSVLILGDPISWEEKKRKEKILKNIIISN